MRQITPSEKLALSRLLEMETNGLTMAKAGIVAISDEQLKTMAQSGISAAEARIMGLQQFIAENNIGTMSQESSVSSQKEAY